MEVGAVKQAFNNEVILLKKNLNQSRIQIIHKLTRRAKQFTEKKAPEKLKEKFKKKAESVINEVLIIKKIKAKDLAKFIATHTGELKDYLNKPKVDHDKACARLLLHKPLQEKYKYIRSRYSNIEIKDLFMSRQERRKIKEEAREKQKKKQKEKRDNKVTSAEGDWDVEDINMAEDSKLSDDVKLSDHVKLSDNGSDDENEPDESESEDENESDENESEDEIESDENESEDQIESDENEPEDENESKNENELDNGNEGSNSEEVSHLGHENLFSDPEENLRAHSDGESVSDESNEDMKNEVEIEKSNNKINKLDETSSVNNSTNENKYSKPIKLSPVKNNTDKKDRKDKIRKREKKHKDNKNKNLNEKLISRKFKKDTDEAPIDAAKVVDPFFITATGESYISVAEPRQPDEIKDVHKQGNRQQRRAAMFGHVPRNKARRDFGSNKFTNQNGFKNDINKFGNKNDTFSNNRSNNNKYDNNNDSFRKSNSNDDRKFNFKGKHELVKSRSHDDKPEKLHPSWEAKKKQSGLLQFKGKKIVFI